MPRKPKDLRSDPSLWGIGVAYCAGILVTLVVIVMVSSGTRSLKFNGRYNQSSASGLDAATARIVQGTGAAGSQNLLQNGSFELPVLHTQSQIVFEDVAGFAWRPAWVVADASKLGRSLKQPGVEILAGYQDWKAHEGVQFVRLDNADLSARAARGKSLVRLSQQVPTDEGAQYKLAFWFAPQPGASAKENIVTVLWNGAVLDTISTDGVKDKKPQWKQYGYTVTGGATGVGIVEFVAGGPENGMGPLLDDASVTPVSGNK